MMVVMSMSLRETRRRPRRHGTVLEPEDRRVLERAGWRTTLDYRENHVRGWDGRLLGVVPVWTAEAERFDGELAAAAAAASSPEEAWHWLREDLESAAPAPTTRRIRVVGA